MSFLTDFELETEIPNQMLANPKLGTPDDWIDVIDPATGRILTKIGDEGSEVVNAVVEKSLFALKNQWRSVTPAERSRILFRAAAEIRANAERLAKIETLDCGKPLRESIGDIETSARYFEYYGGIADKLQGDTIPLGGNLLSLTLHEPVGVTVHIVPWNFPLVQVARGVAAALAAGNTVIVKPAEQTPISALLLKQLLENAGIPEDVYMVVTGRGETTGAALSAHPDINHLTFTGSVPTGVAVMKSAAENVVSVTLELGGKSPVIVLSDADIDDAVEGTLKAIFMNAGQVCSAGSRLIVDRKVHDEIVSRLCDRSNAMTIGHGLFDPDLAAIISKEQLSKIDNVTKAARQRNLNIICGGEVIHPDNCESGFFFSPTIIDDVPSQDTVAQEEIFGPVLAVQIVDGVDEAIRVANDSKYGLVGGIYTRNVNAALQTARDLEVGQVFINQYFAGGVETPFGGVGKSGFGREKGLDALKSYYRVKCITAKIGDTEGLH